MNVDECVFLLFFSVLDEGKSYILFFFGCFYERGLVYVGTREKRSNID